MSPATSQRRVSANPAYLSECPRASAPSSSEDEPRSLSPRSSPPRSPPRSRPRSSLGFGERNPGVADVYGAQYRDLAAEVAWVELGETHEALDLATRSSMALAHAVPTASDVGTAKNDDSSSSASVAAATETVAPDFAPEDCAPDFAPPATLRLSERHRSRSGGSPVDESLARRSRSFNPERSPRSSHRSASTGRSASPRRSDRIATQAAVLAAAEAAAQAAQAAAAAARAAVVDQGSDTCSDDDDDWRSVGSAAASLAHADVSAATVDARTRQLPAEESASEGKPPAGIAYGPPPPSWSYRRSPGRMPGAVPLSRLSAASSTEEAVVLADEGEESTMRLVADVLRGLGEREDSERVRRQLMTLLEQRPGAALRADGDRSWGLRLPSGPLPSSINGSIFGGSIYADRSNLSTPYHSIPPSRVGSKAGSVAGDHLSTTGSMFDEAPSWLRDADRDMRELACGGGAPRRASKDSLEPNWLRDAETHLNGDLDGELNEVERALAARTEAEVTAARATAEESLLRYAAEAREAQQRDCISQIGDGPFGLCITRRPEGFWCASDRRHAPPTVQAADETRQSSDGVPSWMAPTKRTLGKLGESMRKLGDNMRKTGTQLWRAVSADEHHNA